MAYPVCTSLNIVNDAGAMDDTLNERVKRVIDYGFTNLDFNFLNYHDAPNSPFLVDGWEGWVAGAGETAAKYCHRKPLLGRKMQGGDAWRCGFSDRPH